MGCSGRLLQRASAWQTLAPEPEARVRPRRTRMKFEVIQETLSLSGATIANAYIIRNDAKQEVRPWPRFHFVMQVWHTAAEFLPWVFQTLLLGNTLGPHPHPPPPSSPPALQPSSPHPPRWRVGMEVWRAGERAGGQASRNLPGH